MGSRPKAVISLLAGLVNADNLRSIRVLHDDDSHKEGALVRSYAQQRDDAQHLAREIAAEKDAADAMDG
tara:strand:+ start:235 stop:441 length:207 start_codon:yes stop_codon:yes gene_type:complete